MPPRGVGPTLPPGYSQERYNQTVSDVSRQKDVGLDTKFKDLNRLYSRYAGQQGVRGAKSGGGGAPRTARPDGGPPGRLPGQASGKGKKKGGKKDRYAEMDQTDLANEIRDTALSAMRGQTGRFADPRRIQDMKDQLFSSTIGRVKHDVRALDASAVRRGIFRSGMAQRGEADLRRNALNAYSMGVKDIMIKKMEAEFQDKMQGLQATQQWLSQKQNYELGKERNQIARQQIAATMAAAQLSAQVQREGIRAASGRAAAQLNFQKEQFAWQQATQTYDRAAGASNPYGF